MWHKFIAFGLSLAICYGTSVGLGLHESDIPPKWDAAVKKTEYVFSVLYVSLHQSNSNALGLIHSRTLR